MTHFKHQITNKFQYRKTKIQTGLYAVWIFLKVLFYGTEAVATAEIMMS
jgi:hypothetical protein